MAQAMSDRKFRIYGIVGGFPASSLFFAPFFCKLQKAVWPGTFRNFRILSRGMPVVKDVYIPAQYVVHPVVPSVNMVVPGW